MPYNENPNAVSSYRKEREQIDEQLRQIRRSWFRAHMTLFYLAAGVLIAVLVFFGIKWYHDSHNPVSRFISSSGKDLGTSFDFHITAEKNGGTVMSFDGAAAFDPSSQSLSVSYDADYNNYAYRSVIVSGDSGFIKGNLYQGQWTVADCTERVQEYYDFYNDYKHGHFDCGSFLRFTGLNSYLYAQELDSFLDTVRSRLSTDSSVATITTEQVDTGAVYRYELNISELLRLIREQGASIFYTSTDYQKFIERLDANADRIAGAACSCSFTVDDSGYLSELSVMIDTGENTYAYRFAMEHFGEAHPEIPDAFYTAAGLSKPD